MRKDLVVSVVGFVSVVLVLVVGFVVLWLAVVLVVFGSLSVVAAVVVASRFAI